MLPIANSPPSVSPQARQLADAIQAAAEGHVSSPLPQNATGDIALLCSAFLYCNPTFHKNPGSVHRRNKNGEQLLPKFCMIFVFL